MIVHLVLPVPHTQSLRVPMSHQPDHISQLKLILYKGKKRKSPVLSIVLLLEKDIMLGIMPGKRRQDGQKKQWIDNIVQWGDRSLVEMVRQAENRKGYRCLVHEAAYARTSGTVS